MIEQPPPLWLPPKPAIIRTVPDIQKASFLPGMFPGGVTGSRLPRIVFTDFDGSGSDTSTYTFTGKSFGDPSEKRHVIVGFRGTALGSNLNNPNACSIGGVTATLVREGQASTFVQLWIALVPTGETGSVVVSRSGGNMTAGCIVVWAAYDLKSATPVATAYQNVLSSSGNTIDLSLNTPSNGIVVAFASSNRSGQTCTWSGLTEDVDERPAESAEVFGASAFKVPAATPRAISATISGGAGAFRGVAASFQ